MLKTNKYYMLLSEKLTYLNKELGRNIQHFHDITYPNVNKKAKKVLYNKKSFYNDAEGDYWLSVKRT